MVLKQMMFGKVLMETLGLKQLKMLLLQREKFMQVQFRIIKCGSQEDKLQVMQTMFGTAQMESLGLKQEQEQSLQFEDNIRQQFLTIKCKSTADKDQVLIKMILGKVPTVQVGH